MYMRTMTQDKPASHYMVYNCKGVREHTENAMIMQQTRLEVLFHLGMQLRHTSNCARARASQMRVWPH
jgi:hypothetical protein